MANILEKIQIKRILPTEKHYSFFEFLLVVLFSGFTAFLILRNTILIPGYIAIRDTTPLFYNINLASKFNLNNTSDIISFIDLSGLPISFLLSIHVITVQEAQKLSYFLFPFFIGQIAFYYSLKYFAKTYNLKILTKPTYFIPIAMSLSFIYVIEPIPSYFSFWSYMSAFTAFVPLLLAATDMAFVNSEEQGKQLKHSLILAVILSLSMGGPRSFVYSLLLVLLIFIFSVVSSNKYRFKKFTTLLLAGFYFICIDSRILYVIYLGITQNYLNISGNIALQQNWALSFYFPIQQVLSGTSIYWGWVNYNDLVFLSFVPFIIATFFVIHKNTGTFFKYIFILLIFMFCILANVFGIGRIYSVFVSDHLYSYSYIFFTIYIVMIIPPLLYLLFSMGTLWISDSLEGKKLPLSFVKTQHFKILKMFRSKSVKKLAIVLIISFIISSQIVFSYPTLKSGDYDGLYKPVSPPREMVNAGNFLLNSTGYNAIIAPKVTYPPPASNWNSNFSLIQMLSSYKNPLYLVAEEYNNSKSLAHLNYFGIQNLVIVNMFHHYQYIIDKALNSSFLKLVFHQGYIYIFAVKVFKSIISSKGLYLDFNEGLSNYLLNQWNSSLVNLPYYGQDIPLDYIRGIIGVNISPVDIMALITNNYSVNLYNLVNRYSSNPSSPGPHWGYDISYYPFGASGIATNGQYSRSISFAFPKGNYIPLVNGIFFTPSCAGSTHFSKLLISSGSKSEPLNFTSGVGVNYSGWNLGSMISSNGNITITNIGKVYITSIRLIPVSDYSALTKQTQYIASRLSIISAEKNDTGLSHIVPQFNSGMNSTVPGYPYLDYHIVPSNANNVLMIIHPSTNIFGVGNSLLSTTNKSYTSYYIDTTYYYIVLGTDYHFVNPGYVNPTYTGIINFSTVLIAILGTILVRRLKHK